MRPTKFVKQTSRWNDAPRHFSSMPVSAWVRDQSPDPDRRHLCCRPLSWVCCGAAQHPALAPSSSQVNHNKPDSSRSPSIRLDTQHP
jgi:hypothetical protein